MFVFHSEIKCLTEWNLFLYVGGSISVYFTSSKIDSNLFLDIKLFNRNGAPPNKLIGAVEKKSRRDGPSIVDISVEKDEILDNGNEANIDNGLAANLFKQQPATNEHVEAAEVKKVE